MKSMGMILPSITSGPPRPIQPEPPTEPPVEPPPAHDVHHINKSSWGTRPGVLDEGDNEVPDPEHAASHLTGNDLSDYSQTLVKLTVNPGGSSSSSHDYIPGESIPHSVEIR